MQIKKNFHPWTMTWKEARCAFFNSFPYKTGFLSFREIPAVLLALEKISSAVDLIIVDGQGIIHPRRMGIAAHLGLWVDVPTIGCAKSSLYGHYLPPVPEPFYTSPIYNLTQELIGYAVSTKKRAGPLFISPGNHIDCESAVREILRLVFGYRLPEPTRQAHFFANEARRREKAMNPFW